jgi:hypothetical protein
MKIMDKSLLKRRRVLGRKGVRDDWENVKRFAPVSRLLACLPLACLPKEHETQRSSPFTSLVINCLVCV